MRANGKMGKAAGRGREFGKAKSSAALFAQTATAATAARFTHIFVCIYLFSSAFYFIAVYFRQSQAFFSAIFVCNTYKYLCVCVCVRLLLPFPERVRAESKNGYTHTQEERKK